MIVVQCTIRNYITISTAFYISSGDSFALPTGYHSSDMVTFRTANFLGEIFGLKKHDPPDEVLQMWLTLHSYQNVAAIPKATIKRILLTPKATPALAPWEDPVGVLMLLVGAEVPLADDADCVAADVDELELDLLADVLLEVDVPEVEVTVLLSVEVEVEEDEEVEEAEVEEDEVELDVMVAEVDDEALADPTEFEPSTVIGSL